MIFPDGKTFVTAVMVRLNAHGPTALANRMQWGRGVESLVSKWTTGKSAPTFGYTMGMLEECGWLNVEVTPMQEAEEAAATEAKREAARHLAAALGQLGEQRELPAARRGARRRKSG